MLTTFTLNQSRALKRLRLGAAGLLATASLVAGAATADLSMLSDFGRPDIPEQLVVAGVPATGGNIAGIDQRGSSNRASIEQSGGLGNNAEVWQDGVGLSADITQTGSNNEVRLSQVLDLHTAVLVQVGSGNQMAIWQYGSNSDVTGTQEGNGNQLVLQQYGNSQFNFSQIGNQNRMVVDLPNGMSLTVEQRGDNRSFSFHPVP
jgi:minor curlin subunit